MAISTPLRLDAELLRSATAAARLHKRSVPRQIEYWAEIGRAVEGEVSAEDLLALREGLAKLAVDRRVSAPVAPDDVCADLARARRSGSLADRVCESPVRYQSAPDHPGLLERIDGDGGRALGRFEGGAFVKVRRR
jgi:hypothetical protein